MDGELRKIIVFSPRRRPGTYIALHPPPATRILDLSPTELALSALGRSRARWGFPADSRGFWRPRAAVSALSRSERPLFIDLARVESPLPLFI
jgi:hypothetical protein